ATDLPSRVWFPSFNVQEGTDYGTPRDRDGGDLDGTRAESDERLLAGVQLPLRRDDLPAGQPSPQGAPAHRARQAPPAGPLGREPGALLRLDPPQPADQRAR